MHFQQTVVHNMKSQLQLLGLKIFNSAVFITNILKIVSLYKFDFHYIHNKCQHHMIHFDPHHYWKSNNIICPLIYHSVLNVNITIQNGVTKKVSYFTNEDNNNIILYMK